MAQAGSYRRRVDIEQQIQTKDSTGSVVPTWQPIWKAVPCSINQYQGRGHEVFAAQQVQADVTWKISFRWRPDIDASMRIVEYLDAAHTKSTVYNVEAVLPDATNRREITTICRTRLSAGFRTDGA
jgi:SPP1 family predicted phage head-tail adaptor